MTVKVYIWNFDGKTGALGHASLSLSDGTHISWWPSGEDRKSIKGRALKAPPYPDMTLADDIAGENGKNPDNIYQITHGYINEDAIKRWWESFKTDKDWRLFDQNCSTVVYMALCEGNAMFFFPEDEKAKYENIQIWTPAKVGEFVQKLIHYITYQTQPNPSKLGLGNYAGMMS